MNVLDRRFLNISLCVQGIVNTPPANTSDGSQFIVGSNPTGAFSGATANSIARYNGSAWSFSTPKAGELEVINSDNGNILGFNGTAWVTISTPYKPIPPVLAILPTGSTLPASAAAGEAFLNTSDAKLYTATAANTWDVGASTSNGDRYASSSDHNIYYNDGNNLISISIFDGDLFLNKEENYVYIYDATNSAFVKVMGSPSQSSNYITESHTLTATEVTNQVFSLAHSIKSGEECNTLLFVSGIAQTAGIDFTASGNSISWNNYGLADLHLLAGDNFIIHYVTE